MTIGESMQISVKSFGELGVDELYEILKLRVDVFVVEQKCPYPEIDGKDRDSYHVIIRDEEGIAAYARVLEPGLSFKEASIGRVITRMDKRGSGLGAQLMQESIRVARTHFDTPGIRIEAQVYARGFYERQGFVKSSDEFLDDGIPHIEMYLEL